MKRLLVLLLLSGCASQSEPQVKINCPALVNYTSLEQSILADELPLDGPVSQKQIIDYINLRKECR